MNWVCVRRAPALREHRTHQRRTAAEKSGDPNLFLLKGFNVGGQILHFHLDHRFIVIRSSEGVSPDRHIPRAMISYEISALNHAADGGARKFSVFFAEQGQVGRLFLQRRRSRPFPLAIQAMARSAVRPKHLLPSNFRRHCWRLFVDFRLFLANCQGTKSQRRDENGYSEPIPKQLRSISN